MTETSFAPTVTVQAVAPATRGRQSGEDMFRIDGATFAPTVTVQAVAPATRGRQTFNDSDKTNYFED